MAGTFQLEVVSATRMVWEGEAERLIVRTTEGELGVLPRHAPLIALLVPSATFAVAADGRAEVFMVDGGFLSVAEGRVSLISQYARLGREISLSEAEHEFAEAERRLNAGETDYENIQHYQRAKAQIAAARHYQQSQSAQ